jgi:hypothetical protein
MIRKTERFEDEMAIVNWAIFSAEQKLCGANK